MQVFLLVFIWLTELQINAVLKDLLLPCNMPFKFLTRSHIAYVNAFTADKKHGPSPIERV